MATFTTTITPGKIVQELTFDGGVYRNINHDGSLADSFREQICTLYPNDIKLRACLYMLDYVVDDREKADFLAELQAIEDEYAKEKEATSCGNK